ncbi:unnamed protein product, partial [Staurois parvus]
WILGELPSCFLFNFGKELPLNIHTRPEGLGVDGRGGPLKGLVWMGRGTPCRFLFIMVLVFKCNFSFFFLHYSSEIHNPVTSPS